MKDDLLRKLDVLAPHLPTNTLDELVEGLGGPDKVAEMTGRRGRVVSLPNGSVQYQLRSEADVPMEMLNIEEKNRFMAGEKVGKSLYHTYIVENFKIKFLQNTKPVL